MEKALSSSQISPVKKYIQLTKPGIIMGNAITAAGGFILASGLKVPMMLFFMMLIGLSFVIASACVCNNFIDKDLDKKMIRTRNRVLAKGLIKEDHAIIFALILGGIGVGILFHFTNLLTTVAAIFGFFVYVLLYSFSKYLTPLCTLIGSVAGSVPPVVGYVAVKNQIDLGAILIFLLITAWQMPHFYAISMYRFRDYQNAKVPIMPVSKGALATKIRMTFYILLFALAASLLYVYQFVGIVFLIVAAILSAYWLYLSIKGYFVKNDAAWARKMFLYSLIVVMFQCTAIVLGKI